MGNYTGFVTVYESTNGDPKKPESVFWQFFVDDNKGERINVTTASPGMVDTMRFAMETSTMVRVSYDDQNCLLQARIEKFLSPPGK